MIVFDLRCESGHAFEGWFPDSAAFAEQRDAGEVVCPVCGTGTVDKALMAPNIARSREAPTTGPSDPGETGKAVTAAEKERTASFFRALCELRDHVEKNCDYVGDQFAAEARKIRDGDSEQRDIYGEATREEAEDLLEDGVPVMPLPWLPRHDG